MKILILGAGQVGSSVAEILSQETKNEVTVIDNDASALAKLQERLDIQTIKGQASHPEILMSAGARDADILIAATSSDETNMVACELARYLFNIPTKIARIRAASYFQYADIFGNGEGKLAVDVAISPETLVTQQIKNIIELPGARQVVRFARGQVLLVSAQAQKGGKLINAPIRDLPVHMRGIDTRIVAIFRDNQSLEVNGDVVIEEGDEVYFLCAQKYARLMMAELRPLDNTAKRIIIAGGGNIGARLAESLEENYRVKIIEHNPKNAESLARRLPKSFVLKGDCADEELLIEENIENTDIFCAVTNDDQTNILSCMLAKRLGANKVMSLINRSSYVDLVQSESVIDIAFSPQQITIGGLLPYIRRGDVLQVYSLRSGAAEAMEIVAHGDENTSKVIGMTIEEIDWPKGVYLAALARKVDQNTTTIVICHHDTRINAGDHAILFLAHKESIPEVEKLFQVSSSFI